MAQIGAGLLLGALDGAQSAQYPGNFAAQGLLGLGQCGALLGRQAAGLIWGLRLALGVQQGEHHVAVVAVEGKLALTGKGFQCSKGLGLRSFVVGDERGVVGAVVGFLQALGNVAGQGLQQFVHALAQQSALACGQAQRVWALGFVKVVQIAQVRRHRAQRSGLVHGLGQQRAAAAAQFAQHKQVVVGLLHSQAKAHSGGCALLANPRQGLALQLASVRKTEGARVNL